MLGQYFSLNGQLLPVEEAVVSIDNLEFSYGYGVYETLKLRKKILFFPEKHAERLFKSAQTIGLPVPLSFDCLLKALHEFVQTVPEESANIKIQCVGSSLYIFATAPQFISDKLYRSGVKTITYFGERQFPQAKTLNMTMSYLAYKTARERDAYDALLVDKEGRVCEGTRTNLFFTDGKIIFTPLPELVLEGVTKITLFEALQEKGIPIEERILRKEELPQYLGYFLTSTSSKLLPVSEIDGMRFGIPEIVRQAMTIYDDYLKEYERACHRSLTVCDSKLTNAVTRGGGRFSVDY